MSKPTEEQLNALAMEIEGYFNDQLIILYKKLEERGVPLEFGIPLIVQAFGITSAKAAYFAGPRESSDVRVNAMLAELVESFRFAYSMVNGSPTTEEEFLDDQEESKKDGISN